ncbi:hypothetical protein [Streptomyces sp. NPDC056169]|uniref:hypothetical protein n=1 Tax=Streptomyces sp. NPDC056169 TaxID=3345734 RepID=UPI0035D734C7
MTAPWTPTAEDDPLDGLRAVLVEAECGYEPKGGYEDRCWLLHAIHDGPVRLRWDEVLGRVGRRFADWSGTPSYLVFEGVDGAAELDGPDPAEMDRACLVRLVELLARHAPQGPDTPCGGAQAPVDSFPGERFLAWRGGLGAALAHYDACNGPGATLERRFPATWWAADGSWLVLTDWDLSATEVFGDVALIADLLADPELDAVRHPSIAETFGD